MVYRIEGIRLALERDDGSLKQAAAQILGIGEVDIARLLIIRRAIDARRHRPPAAVYVVDVQTSTRIRLSGASMGGITVKPRPGEPDAGPDFFFIKKQQRPIVVGCGPAGLFAALVLVLHGIPVLLLERGKAVHERATDVAAFWQRGAFHEESHVQFGEGGAGTFSDGKLTYRAKNPLARWVKRVLVDMGAPSNILTDAKPHIGTDRLRDVVTNLRNYIIMKGGEVRFGSKMTDLLIHHGQVAGVVVNDAEEVRTDCLILASGQSADDTYHILSSRGVPLEPKPFAMGLRVEHPQRLINAIQYGAWVHHPKLPPAEYFLTDKTQGGERSVYTFCMCPGGQVIGSSARAGTVVTNGMSNALRNGDYANSAVVVNVRVEDFHDEKASPLSGLAFRQRYEASAFDLGGRDYRAPAERLLHFLDDKMSPDVAKTTFRPGVCAVPLHTVLPLFIVEALKEGLRAFDAKMPGFVSMEANLIGIETRTSSPVRMIRGADGQSAGIGGLYPCGEGSGYAGGIISSALDGVRSAQQAARR